MRDADASGNSAARDMTHGGATASDRMGKVADAIAQNVVLQAVARIASALLIPAVLWVASEILSLEKRMSTSEASQSAISGRLETIESATRAGAAADSQALASVAVLQAGQQHTLQMLGVIADNLRRVERRLDDMMTRQTQLNSRDR